MSLIDAGVGIVLLYLVWHGFWRGLTGSLVWVATLVLTPYVAGYLTPHVAAWLKTDAPFQVPALLLQPVAVMASLALAGSVVGIVAALVASQVRRLGAAVPAFTQTDRVLGALVGIVTGAIGLGLATTMVAPRLSAAHKEDLASSVWGGSVMPLFAPLAPYATALVQWLPGGPTLTLGAMNPESIAAVAAGDGNANAARLLLIALEGNPALAASAGAMPGGADPTRLFLQALAGESSAEGLPDGSADAVKGLLETLAAGSPAASGQISPEGTTAAARMLLKALTASAAAPLTASVPSP